MKETFLPTNYARHIIDDFNYFGATSTERLSVLSRFGISTTLILDWMEIDWMETQTVDSISFFSEPANENLTYRVYQIKDWNNSSKAGYESLWENVFIVHPNAIIESPSIVNIKDPKHQLKTHALLQIILWPDFYGISLNEEILNSDSSEYELTLHEVDSIF